MSFRPSGASQAYSPDPSAGQLFITPGCYGNAAAIFPATRKAPTKLERSVHADSPHHHTNDHMCIYGLPTIQYAKANIQSFLVKFMSCVFCQDFLLQIKNQDRENRKVFFRCQIIISWVSGHNLQNEDYFLNENFEMLHLLVSV